MTSRQFVAVALRLFAIWLVMAAVQSILSTFVETRDVGRGAYLAYAALYVVVAAFLWTFPMMIAGRILSAAPGDSPMIATPRGIVHAAIIAAGLLLIVQSLPRLLMTFTLVVVDPDRSGASSQAITLVSLAIPALQIALALVMVFRAPDLARLIQPRELERRADGDL